MLHTYNCDVRFSLDSDSTMRHTINVIDTITNLKALLVRLAGNDGTSIAFIEIKGETTYTLCYNAFVRRFKSYHFNGLIPSVKILREFYRDENLKHWERKQQRKKDRAQEIGFMKKA